MDQTFHYDPAKYHVQVAQIAQQVIPGEDAIPTIAPRVDFETNSYHGSEIRKAEHDRQSKLYPRLYL